MGPAPLATDFVNEMTRRICGFSALPAIEKMLSMSVVDQAIDAAPAVVSLGEHPRGRHVYLRRHQLAGPSLDGRCSIGALWGGHDPAGYECQAADLRSARSDAMF
jgi:hypothetical protein